MFYDILDYTIHNVSVLIFISLYPILLLISPVPIDWLGGIYAMFALLFAGYLIYAFGIAGGGDGKFLAACGLWCGWEVHTVSFIIYMALIGGALSLLLIIGRPIGFYFIGRITKGSKIPRILEEDAPIPYGLAIAGSFLIMLWTGALPGMEISLTSLMND